MTSIVRNAAGNCPRAAGIYGLWLLLHYGAARAYPYYCTPSGIAGFIATPLLVAAPHCTGLRWCIASGADAIATMWIVAATWIASLIALPPRR